MTSHAPTLEKVLDQLAVEPELSARTVRKYLDMYPQYEGDILDFALECVTPDDPAAPLTSAMEVAGDRLLDGLMEAAGRSTPAGNPLAGVELAGVERETGIARPLLDALRKGLVEAGSVPDVVIRKLVAFTSMTRDTLLSRLAIPAPATAVMEFKSRAPASVPQQRPFDYFLENSGLSDKEKQRVMAD